MILKDFQHRLTELINAAFEAGIPYSEIMGTLRHAPQLTPADLDKMDELGLLDGSVPAKDA